PVAFPAAAAAPPGAGAGPAPAVPQPRPPGPQNPPGTPGERSPGRGNSPFASGPHPPAPGGFLPARAGRRPRPAAAPGAAAPPGAGAALGAANPEIPAAPAREFRGSPGPGGMGGGAAPVPAGIPGIHPGEILDLPLGVRGLPAAARLRRLRGGKDFPLPVPGGGSGAEPEPGAAALAPPAAPGERPLPRGGREGGSFALFRDLRPEPPGGNAGEIGGIREFRGFQEIPGIVQHLQ
ncbi:unnamed protein product, partial [Coccothraustes coccothraustes]